MFLTKSKILIAFLLLLTIIFSCNKTDESIKQKNIQKEKVVTNTIINERITLDKAKSIIDNRKRVEINIIDIRTPKEYTSGHLDRSQNIDFYQDFKYNINKLKKNKKYLIYCQTGNRTKSALKTMKELGFKSVYEMDKGIAGWREKGWRVKKK